MLKNKKFLISALVLALAFAGAGYYVYAKDQQQKEAQKTDQQQLQEEEKQAGVRDPKTESEAYQRQQSQQSSTNSSTSGSNTSGAANPTITQLGQSGDSIYVNAIVDGQKSGTCTLEATKSGSATVTRTANLGLVTSYYACQGFNVERSAFGSAGNWNVVVKFSNGSTSGTSESRSLTIQ